MRLTWPDKCSLIKQNRRSAVTITCLTMLTNIAALATANRDGVNGSRSLEEDMAPLYQKLLLEIQINLGKNLPAASGSAQQTSLDLCPDLRTRLTHLKGNNQKLMTIDERLCERVQGNACLNHTVWRARAALRKQLSAACGVPD